MKALQTAIYTKVTALVGGLHNSFYNDITGRFYYGYAPQDATFPYCIYHIVNTNYDFMFVEEFEDVIVQFNICSQSPSSSEIGTILSDLQSLFDWCTLTITGYTSVSVERIFSSADWYDEEGVWEMIVQYRILLKKS